jgi:hypothetical protein
LLQVPSSPYKALVTLQGMAGIKPARIRAA